MDIRKMFSTAFFMVESAVYLVAFFVMSVAVVAMLLAPAVALMWANAYILKWHILQLKSFPQIISLLFS